METQTIDKQAFEIVQNFSQSAMKGELLRNRLGNRAWPIASKALGFCKWGILGLWGASVALGNPLPLASLAVVGGGHLAHTWAKGHIKYLQNLTFANAALLGRTLKNSNLPEAVKTKAIEKFIQQESPLFTAKEYIEKNPDQIERLSQGLSARKNKNFVSFWDTNINKIAGKNISFSERLAVYKKTFQQWRNAVAEEKSENLSKNNTEKNSAKETSELSTKQTIRETGATNIKSTAEQVSLANLKKQLLEGSLSETQKSGDVSKNTPEQAPTIPRVQEPATQQRLINKKLIDGSR